MDRIDNNLCRKHSDRESSDCTETLQLYKIQTQKLLYSAKSFDDNTVHNIQKVSIDIINFKNEPYQPQKHISKKKNPVTLMIEYQDLLVFEKQHRGFNLFKRSQIRSLLLHKKEMTAQFRKRHNIHSKTEYRYYYDDSRKLLEDFQRYKQESQTNLTTSDKRNRDNAKTMANNVRDIWMEVDPRRSILPRNFLNDPNLIEDNFYRPYLKLILKNQNLPKEKHIQPSTIKSKVCSLSVFC